MGEWQDTLAGKIKGWQGSNALLLDVGAYEGDFTDEMLRTNWFEQAFLFDCNPVNVQALQQKFAAEERVHIVPLAVGSTLNQRTFYCNDDRATGSVLPYAHDETNNTRSQHVQQWRIEQTTLDHFAAQHLPDRHVGLIKVDTQGNDLEVLKGAQELIRTHRPWIVVELLYVPLYQGQGTPLEIFSWLTAQGYGLGMQLLEHYTEEGWLAFADCVFIPNETLRQFTPKFHPRPETNALQQQVARLNTTCQERLDLIQRIHAEAVELREQLAAQQQSLRESNRLELEENCRHLAKQLEENESEIRLLKGPCDKSIDAAPQKNREVAQLWEQLTAKETEIQGLLTACKERLDLIENLTKICAERELVIAKLSEMLDQRQKAMSK